jgi:glutaminase
MVDFLQKAMNWVLKKEQEVAQNCKISREDINRQIAYVEEKKERLQQEYEENLKKFEEIIGRLHSLRPSEEEK